MIYDAIRNIDAYSCLGKNFKTAVDFIKSLDLSNAAEQNFDVDGKEVFAFIKGFPLRSREEGLFETHDKYVDIQVLIKGRESVYVADKAALKEALPYDTEKDIAFFENPKEDILCELTPNTFGIFFPWDAHNPCCVSGDAKESLKLVVKVKL